MAKIIAVTGNTCKTVFSAYLSQLLSNKQKVLMVSTDSLQPVSKMLFPSKRGDGQCSLGKLLSLPVITKRDIFDQSSVVAANWMILSYAEGESHMNYPEISDIALQNMFRLMDSIADYIILDTATARNPIDDFVLSKNPEEVCITSADNKGIAYRQFYRTENALPVLYCYAPANPLSDIQDTFERPVKHLLPYHKHLTLLYNGVDLTDIPAPRTYRKILTKIAGEIQR